MSAVPVSPRATRKPRRKAAEQPEIPPRVARRERRREQSREEIVAAARRVMLRDGIGATTLEAVAKEVGLTKAALYYYYPSKDALYFELIFGAVEAESRAIHDAVAETNGGGEALRALIRETVHTFAARMDDFRLTFMHGQVAGSSAVRFGAEQFARIRPLNELAYAGATATLAREWKHARGRAGVEPRLMVFLANVAAIGVLTVKGMVENLGDPLRYSDEQLIDGLARIFEAAAEP